MSSPPPAPPAPSTTLPRIGVVAAQGDFQAHLAALAGRAEAWPVRTPEDLERHGGVEGVVLPGGESTTMIRLLQLSGLWGALDRLGERGVPIFGTCAGAILLAREVEGAPSQDSLGLLDVRIRRNAYGRQVDSFETTADSPLFPGEPLAVVCIRAPRIVATGPDVEVLAELRGDPIWVRQGRIWAATFHPELTGDARPHQAFVDGVRSAAAGGGAS